MQDRARLEEFLELADRGDALVGAHALEFEGWAVFGYCADYSLAIELLGFVVVTYELGFISAKPITIVQLRLESDLFEFPTKVE